MASSQMRCGHNQPPSTASKWQEQGKSARLCWLPESRFLKKERARLALTVFSSLFRKQLRLFNENSGVNLAYIYDAIVPSKHKRFSDRLSSFSCRRSITRGMKLSGS